MVLQMKAQIRTDEGTDLSHRGGKKLVLPKAAKQMGSPTSRVVIEGSPTSRRVMGAYSFEAHCLAVDVDGPPSSRPSKAPSRPSKAPVIEAIEAHRRITGLARRRVEDLPQPKECCQGSVQ